IMTLGALSAVTAPQGHLAVPLWVGEGYYPWLAGAIYRARMGDVYLASRHDETRDDPDEFPDPQSFQLLRGDETLMQSSASMGAKHFPIDDELRRSDLFTERLDTVTIDGKQMRRVTFKGAVAKVKYVYNPFTGRRPIFKGTLPPPKRPSIFER